MGSQHYTGMELGGWLRMYKQVQGALAGVLLIVYNDYINTNLSSKPKGG
jgi:hypothetical protein